MATTTKKALIDRLVRQSGQPRAVVKAVLECCMDVLIDELRRGNRLEFRDFGVFEIKHRRPRVGQNPKTLVQVRIPARRTVKFKPSRVLRSALDSSVLRERSAKQTITATIETFRRGGGRSGAGRRGHPSGVEH